MIVLKYTQPVLFTAIINFTQLPGSNRNEKYGYGIIAATALLYLSLTFATTYYQHKTYQLVTKSRGALVAFLYAKTLASKPQSLSDKAPITLMSIDVDGITGAAPKLHEMWAAPMEMGIAVWLLQRQIGAVCIAPLAIALSKLQNSHSQCRLTAVLVCTGTAIWLSRRMGKRQATWNKATQERIAATSTILQAMKSIKVMGFAEYVSLDIRRLRDSEIYKSKLFRRLTVFINLLGVSTSELC